MIRKKRSKEHRCSHCMRTFNRAEHLSRHVRTHTKEKPFVCSCRASFTRKDLLTRHHRLSHHEGTSSPTPPVIFNSDVDLDRAAAAEGLSNLSGVNVQAWPAVVAQPGPNDFGDVDQREQQTYHPAMDAPQLFDQNQEYTGFDQFREFAGFLDGIGLPAEWSPYFNPDDLIDPGLHQADHVLPSASSRPTTRPGTPFSSWLPSAPNGNGQRTAGPDSADPRAQQEVASKSFRVTDEQCVRLSQSLESFRHVLEPDFRFPSRHTLTRYISSYFEGFHTHMVFLHTPTWRLLGTPIEVLLSIAAIGAQYSFEHRMSERLFRAGRAIVIERLARQKDRFGPKTSALLGIHSPGKSVKAAQAAPDADQCNWEPIDAVRTLINLTAFATWEPKPHLVQEAFALQSFLAQVLRDLGLKETESRDDPNSPPHESWLHWVREESIRRAKFIGFAFIHVHSIAYNVYPTLRTNEVQLRLPCETKVWKAANATQWQAARQDVSAPQLGYQDALSLLLRNNDSAVPLSPIPTALGNYLLLHGLLQRIYIVRDLSLPLIDNAASLPEEEVEKLERGLRGWTSNWQQGQESSLDPNNENGPIPFTSSSLLGLAYVRIYLNLGPYRQLETRDPVRIAEALSQCPDVERSDGVISALLYAAHALSIPVRLGIDRVARSQAFFWSVRHSLSGLECAVLLSKWLATVHVSYEVRPPNASEERILNWVRRIVEEALAVVDFEEDEEDSVVPADAQGLSMAVLKIWAHFFRQNTQWPFINIIGVSLHKYRKMLMAV